MRTGALSRFDGYPRLDGLPAQPREMTAYDVSGSARPPASGPMDPRDAG
jgi:hypothetical protein